MNLISVSSFCWLWGSFISEGRFSREGVPDTGGSHLVACQSQNRWSGRSCQAHSLPGEALRSRAAPPSGYHRNPPRWCPQHGRTGLHPPSLSFASVLIGEPPCTPASECALRYRTRSQCLGLLDNPQADTPSVMRLNPSSVIKDGRGVVECTAIHKEGWPLQGKICVKKRFRAIRKWKACMHFSSQDSKSILQKSTTRFGNLYLCDRV